jgi:hypothetical protein
MIRNEIEYRTAREQLDGAFTRLVQHRARLTESGLSDGEIKRVLDPLSSLRLGLKEEIEAYEASRDLK